MRRIDDIRSRVCKVVSDVVEAITLAPCDPTLLQPSAHGLDLADQLDFDSVDMVELLLEVECEFNCQIGATSTETIEHLVQAVSKSLDSYRKLLTP